MITSRNRQEVLSRTLARLSHLNPAPMEVLVTADGCEDGTVRFLEDWAKDESNHVEWEPWNTDTKGQNGERGADKRVIVNPVGLGSVASRDQMMKKAKGELVLALDDDSYPEQADALAHLSLYFEENPKLAVIGLPQRTDEYPESLTQADFGSSRMIRSFSSSGAVLRRSIYLMLPGFAHEFFHMYEEPDYTLQCVAAGYEAVFMPNAPTIRHHWTGSGRSEIRNHHRHARNELWSTLMRCPMPHALWVAAYRIFSQARYAGTRGPGWLLREPNWWWLAIQGLPRAIKKRQPVRWKEYRKWLSSI